MFSGSLIAPIMYDTEFGIFPVDSCFTTIEVKTTRNATKLKSAIYNGKSLQHDKIHHISGQFGHDGQTVPHQYTEILRTLFAFDTDLTDGGKDEFERYKENDDNWST